MGNVYTFLKKCKLVEPRGEVETPAGMTRTCCREAEGRGLSRLHVETTAVTMPAISTAISRCAGRCGDRPRRSCHGHAPTQSLRQTLACSDPSALGKCGAGFRLLRPIDAPARFARRLAKGCGNPHHEGLAEPAKRLLVRPDVPGSFGDIVIVFVGNDPAALAVAKACPPALDIMNFQGDPIGLRRLGCDREKRQMRRAIIRATDGDHDAGPVGSSGLRFRRARVATPRDRDKQSPDRAGTLIVIPRGRASRSISAARSSLCSSGISEARWTLRGSPQVRIRS